MPVQPADLVCYHALNAPADDTSLAGGAVNPQMRVNFTDAGAGATVEVLSSSTLDITPITMTITARNSAGTQVAQTLTLVGLSPIQFLGLGTLDRIQSAQLSAPCAGTVTVRQQGSGTIIGLIPPGELGFMRLFEGAFASLGGPKTYYQKVFYKNNNATYALLAPSIHIHLATDPLNVLNFAVENVIDGTATLANRLTQPATAAVEGPGLYDLNDKNVPSASLAPGHSIGVWLQFPIAVGAAPVKGFETLQIIGSLS